MGTGHEPQYDAIDKALAALNTAALPEGMQARIAQRLQQATTPASFHWRDLFAGSTLAAAWWRGAASGAAVAMLASAALLLAGHLLPPYANSPQPMATNRAAATNSPAAATPIKAESLLQPCATPRVLRAHSVAPTRPTDPLRAESYAENSAPSHPAPEMPLTAQERALVRLAQTADAKDVGTLDPDTEAKLEERDAAEFKRFFAPLFTPPPTPPATETNE